MKLLDAYTKLRKLNLPAIQTQDAAAYLNITVIHANKILSRLADAKQLIHLKHGTWIFSDTDPLALPNFLTAPFPAYVSLQTALYYHGMISQIPSIIYAVSLARTRVYKTPLSTISVHHVQPSFFFGYEQKNNGLLKIAIPEKALIDILYLSPTKSRLFHTLPELELPQSFRIAEAKKIINKISSPGRKTLVERRFFEFLQKVD